PLITSIAAGYHDAVIAASSTELLYVFDDDLDTDLTLSAPVASVGLVVASPRSPYVVAGSEGVVLVWNLDDMLPRAVPTPRPVSMGIVGTKQLIVQSLDGDVDWIDLETGDKRSLPRVIGPLLVRSPIEGNVAALTAMSRDSIVAFRDGRPPIRVGRN